MSSKQIVEPTEEINILLRRTAVPKCDITPAVKGLINMQNNITIIAVFGQPFCDIPTP